jgi:hypothetical protein
VGGGGGGGGVLKNKSELLSHFSRSFVCFSYTNERRPCIILDVKRISSYPHVNLRYRNVSLNLGGCIFCNCSRG